MAYITVQDIKDLLPENILIQLTYDGTGERSIDDAKIEEAIWWSEARVDGFLSKRYSVPLTGTIPDIIKACAKDLTVYRLYARVEKEDAPEDKRKAAESMLQKIADGDILLPTDKTTSDIRHKARTKVFTEEALDESDS